MVDTDWGPQAACPGPLLELLGNWSPLCHASSWGKCLSVWVRTDPHSALVPPAALQTQAWSFLPEVHDQDPAMATRILMAKDQVSLGSLFPNMTL